VIADGGEIEDGSTLTGTKTEGSAFQIASIDLSFDTDGSITSMTSNYTSSSTPWNYVGAEVFGSGDEYAFNFGQDADGDGLADNNGAISQFASSSTVTSLNQEGYSVGHLTSIVVETDGTVVGRYDNGQDLTLGQVTVASFDSVNGLERMGGNLFRAARIPGEPTLGIAGEGGRGDIFGSSLEASNVDIEDEFVNMITAQRSYQANSRVLSATNELLRELVNLV
jgi:flagellar hook protein FlgE